MRHDQGNQLIIKYNPSTEWCDLCYPYNRRFNDLIKSGIQPTSYRKWSTLAKHWQVHITRLPLVVAFGKRYFGHVDYSDLPEPLQIELVQQIQEQRHREPLAGAQRFADMFAAEWKKQRAQAAPQPISREIKTRADALIVLHLRSTAPPEVIKAAYRALARLMHPDSGGNEEDFKHLQKAYEVLTKSQQ